MPKGAQLAMSMSLVTRSPSPVQPGEPGASAGLVVVGRWLVSGDVQRRALSLCPARQHSIPYARLAGTKSGSLSWHVVLSTLVGAHGKLPAARGFPAAHKEFEFERITTSGGQNRQSSCWLSSSSSKQVAAPLYTLPEACTRACTSVGWAIACLWLASPARKGQLCVWSAGCFVPTKRRHRPQRAMCCAGVPLTANTLLSPSRPTDAPPRLTIGMSTLSSRSTLCKLPC